MSDPSSIHGGKAYQFHSLDLREGKVKEKAKDAQDHALKSAKLAIKSKDKYVELKHLDLQKSKAVKQKEKKEHPERIARSKASEKTQTILEDHAKRIDTVTKPLYRQGLYIPAAEYGRTKITPSTCNDFSCDDEEVKGVIRKEVESITSHADYNSFHIVTGFLEFFEAEREKNPDITEAAAFAKFKPDSSNEFLKTQGSSCTGLSIALKNRLEEKGIKTHVVLERASLDAPPNHAATAIPCKDGVMFVEVLAGFHGDDPITSLKPDETMALALGDRKEIQIEIKFIQTLGNYRSTQPMITRKEENTEDGKVSQSEYVLRPVLSPDDTVMKRYVLVRPTYPIEKQNGNDSTSISIDFQRQSIKFQVLEEGKPPQSRIVRFDKFDTENKTINFSEEDKKVIDEKFFSRFSTPEAILKEQLFTMVRHKDTMKNLYAQVRK